MDNYNRLGYLDKMRLGYNATSFRRLFRESAQQNRRKAFRDINEVNIQFPSLFILIPEIEALNLYENISPRNRIALKICSLKVQNPNLDVYDKALPPQGDSEIRQALKWMFTTGVQWDGPESYYDVYDEIIDAVTALLIIMCDDKTILPSVVNLIFRRNRKDLFIHDLVWSFFQTFDPNALRLVANYLLSQNYKDVELACNLLNLELPERSASWAAKQKLYQNYLQWLGDNSSYLYLTGEHFQLTSSPHPLDVDLQSKYLCKKISPKTRKIEEKLSENEIMSLRRFLQTSKEEQEILSAYSHKIHSRNTRSWSQWMQMQLAQQVSMAKADLEV